MEAKTKADDHGLSGCVSRDKLKRAASKSRMREIIGAHSISSQLNAVAASGKKWNSGETLA